jgi:hypothetical protein
MGRREREDKDNNNIRVEKDRISLRSIVQDLYGMQFLRQYMIIIYNNKKHITY